MFKVNEDYLKLPGSYLFSTIGKKVAAFQEANPDKKIIRLGIGDVTQPLAPAIIESLHSAVDEMASAETFHGYAPDLGYEFLRSAMAKNDYQARGCDIKADEIFISDGAKCDSGNIQEIFSKDNKITVMIMVSVLTIIYEIGSYMLKYAFLNINIEILAFSKILLVETLYNIILTIIIYPIMQLTGYDVEEEYKGSKILTRYF